MLSTWLVFKDVSGCAQPSVQPSESQVTEVKKEQKRQSISIFPLLSTQDFYLYFKWISENKNRKENNS